MKGIAGRLRRALAAGRQAAQGPATVATGPSAPPRPVALMPLGVGPDEVLRTALSFAAARPATARIVVIADGVPDLLVRDARFAVEDLAPPVAPVHEGEGHEEMLAHRARRLRLILDRWHAAECHWSGRDAEEIVRWLLTRAVLEPVVTAFRPLS